LQVFCSKTDSAGFSVLPNPARRQQAAINLGGKERKEEREKKNNPDVATFRHINLGYENSQRLAATARLHQHSLLLSNF
jgi:hypothetical protein